ncbi:MAG TPA: hypothetical protein VGX78_17935 [Pirellulales bacterium]|jgi:hypothetical protein|nr:hypothetical protein [Pirellulales bacterium]
MDWLPTVDEALANGDPATWHFLASYQQALGRAKSDAQATLAAWYFTRLVLDQPQLKASQRTAAVHNTVDLWPQLPRQVTADWLRDVLAERPGLGLFLLAEIGRQVETASATPDLDARERALATLRQFVAELLSAAKDDVGRWSTPLEMLTACWLREAERSSRQGQQNRSYHQAQRRSVRAPRSAAARYPNRQRNFSPFDSGDADEQADANDVPPLAPEVLLPLAPDEAWCRAIDPDLARRVRHLTGVFAARSADRDQLVEALARLTAFNLVVLLKRIYRDDVLGLSPAERAGLGETIESLERDYFGAPAPSAVERDLEPLLNRWLARAGHVQELANGAAR